MVMSLVNCEISSTYIHFFSFNIISILIKKSELVLDLDVVEADAMEESDGIQDIRNLEREEDLFDYDGIALDVGGPSDDAPEDEWDPLNFD